MKKSIKLLTLVFSWLYLSGFTIQDKIEPSLEIKNPEEMFLEHPFLGEKININDVLLTATEPDPFEFDAPEQYCMKDEYFNFVQNQTNTGLCWCYGASMALSKTLERVTNEYTDFSEVYIASTLPLTSSSYVPGAGGWNTYFENAAKANGLIYEHDLQAPEAWLTFKSQLGPYRDFYMKNVNKITMKNIEYVKYDCRKQRDQIKYHLMNHGGFSLTASWKTTELTQTSDGKTIYAKIPNEKNVSGAHAVCVVGWDDNITKEYDGTTYKGAWIVQNSYGERELNQGGTSYLFYDDKQIRNDFSGYKISNKIEEDTGINFLSRIDNSNSHIINNHVGTYFVNFEITSGEYKQKNIFYGKDVNLEYSYTISPETTIEDISIFNCDIDMTSYFDININEDEKSYSIKNYEGYPLDYGSYTVKIKLSRGDKSDYAYNCFYCLNGAEVNTMLLASINGLTTEEERSKLCGSNKDSTILDPVSFVENNGHYFLFNTNHYSPNIRELTLATTKTEGYFDFDFYINFTDEIDRVELDGKVLKTDIIHKTNRLTIPYSGFSNTNKQFKGILSFIAKNGNHNDIPLTIDYAKPTDKYLYLKMDTDGGVNPNPSKFLHNVGDNFTLKAPTRPGYKFKGWYYDAKRTKPLSKVGDEYLFDDDNLIYLGVGSSSENYGYMRYRYYYCRTYTGYVYADWEFDPIENIELVLPKKVYLNDNTPIKIKHKELNGPAYNYKVELELDGTVVGEFTNESFSYNFTDSVTHTAVALITCTYNGHEYAFRSSPQSIKAINETPAHQTHKIEAELNNCSVSGLLEEYQDLQEVNLVVTPNPGYKAITEVLLIDEQGNAKVIPVTNGVIRFYINDSVRLIASTTVDQSQFFNVSLQTKNATVSGLKEKYNVGEEVTINIAPNRKKYVGNIYVIDENGKVISQYNESTNTISFVVTGNMKIVAEFEKEKMNTTSKAVIISMSSVLSLGVVAEALVFVLRKRKII